MVVSPDRTLSASESEGGEGVREAPLVAALPVHFRLRVCCLGLFPLHPVPEGLVQEFQLLDAWQMLSGERGLLTPSMVP